MGLLDRFKPRPKTTTTTRLPFAEPGFKAIGSHYFEENIARVPAGTPELQIVAAPGADWGKIQVLWQGLRIGHLGMEEKQERALLNVLLQMGPAGTVFVAAGETMEERAVDLNVKGSKLQSRTRVRLMIPSPDRLAQWHKASPADRAGIQLSETKTVQVRLKGQGTVQDTLESLVAGNGEFHGKADIAVGTEASGKYKGSPSLTFSVRGAIVGVVGGRYQEEEPALFGAVLERGLKTFDLRIRRNTFGENALYSTVDVI